MSSEQPTSPQRGASGSSGGNVSEAKIIATGGTKADAPSGAVTPAAGQTGKAGVTPASSGGTPASSSSPAPFVATPRAATESGQGVAGSAGASAAGAGKPGAQTAAGGEPPALAAPQTIYVQRRSWSWLLLLLIMMALAAGGWWYVQQRLLAQERQQALRLQEAEERAASLEEQIRQLHDAQQQLQTRGSALENRVAESSAQQEQLQALYDDVARVRGDARIAEVERALTLANQHLSVSGNVKGALMALEGAEKQLSDSEQSQAIGLRRVILQDIEKLKSLPEVDLTRNVARLDEVISRVDSLPFLSDPVGPESMENPQQAPAGDGKAPGTAGGEPSAAALGDGAGGQDAGGAGAGADDTQADATGAGEPGGTDEAAAGSSAGEAGVDGAAAGSGADASGAAAGTEGAVSASADEGGWRSWYRMLVDSGSRAADAVHEEFRSLVKIRRIDEPDRLLLAPDQKRSVRESLRLQLLGARVNLLNRNEALFRQDLVKSSETISRFFDTHKQDVKSSLSILTELQSEPLQLKLPTLDDSMAALQAFRAESEKRF